MDRVTTSLLSTFSKEHDLSNKKESSQFEHYISYIVTSSFVRESFTTSDIVTGNGNDTGIDGISTIINGKLVTDIDSETLTNNQNIDCTFIFIQTETSSSFDSGKILKFGHGSYDFFSEHHKLPRNKDINNHHEIMTKIYNNSKYFTPDTPKLKLYYATTGTVTKDANIEANINKVKEDLRKLKMFSSIDFILIGANEIRKLDRQCTSAISREFNFESKVALPEIDGISEAYIGILPAKNYLSLIQDEEGNLEREIFNDNIRDYQGENTVNERIKNTLQSESESKRFPLMNNGITIITKTLKSVANKFNIEDYQIVNGCQTSNVLWENRKNIDDDMLIPLRLISTKDDNVINSIVGATNRQTAIREDQLIALSEFSKRLEDYFKSFEGKNKLYYERRSRQYDKISGIEKTRIIGQDKLIKSYASVFLETPHQATRDYQSIVKKIGKGKGVFEDDHKLIQYYTSAHGYYRLEFLFRNSSLENKYKAFRFQLLLIFKLYIEPNPSPPKNSNKMEGYCEKINAVLGNKENSKDTFKNAGSILLELSDGTLNRDKIRTHEFTKKIISRFRDIRK